MERNCEKCAGYIAQHHRDSAELRRVCAERDQLRAEKQEFRAEATRWAEEAGRLKALLHDAQRDADRYRWIRDCTKDGCVESAILDHARYAEVKMGKRLDAAIDAAMAAEREGQG